VEFRFAIQEIMILFIRRVFAARQMPFFLVYLSRSSNQGRRTVWLLQVKNQVNRL